MFCSCEPDNQEIGKQYDSTSILNNVEFTGVEQQKETFKLKAKTATIKLQAGTPELQLHDVSLLLLRSNAKIYSVFAKTGTYSKSDNVVILNDSNAYTKDNKIKIKAGQLKYDEKTKIIQAKKITIEYFNHSINGEFMEVKEQLNLINLHRVKAKFNF